MRITCVGINYKKADVALRERLAFDDEAADRAMRDFAGRWPSAELVILSTCNRTELYVAAPAGGRPNEGELLAWLADFHGVEGSILTDTTYVLADAAAVRHLLAVAAGLDSMVVGEAQITGQVKAAYAAARKSGTARPIMNELFQAALHVAKHVRTETDIGTGKVSVASAAIDCAAESLGGLHGKCVLNVGAGKMNELMLRHLADLGAGRILVANRSHRRAVELARKFSGQAVELNDLGKHLANADVVLTSTGAGRAIITREMVAKAQQRRAGRPLLIIDLAVPRDVEHEVGQLDNVALYDIDDLQRVVASSFQGRHHQLVQAEAIVASHLAEILRRLKVRQVAPTIEAMYRFMRGIADEELASAENKLSNHQDSDADKEVLRRMLRRTIGRILHPMARNLRKSSTSDSSAHHVAALRRLFGLDEQ